MILPDEIIQSGQDYYMVIQLPGLNYLQVWWARLRIISNCRDLGMGASFKLSEKDTWYLNYTLLDEKQSITHREFFALAVESVEPNAVGLTKIESGEKAGLITGGELFACVKEYWYIGMVFVVCVMIIPVFYKRGR